MKELLEHLNRIAKANNDTFKYAIFPILRKSKVYYQFSVEEDYENHNFVRCTVDDLESIPQTIDEDLLKEACEAWSYKYVN